MESPKVLRTEIESLRASVDAIKQMLSERVKDPRQPTWGVGRDCAKAVDSLGKILDQQQIPPSYKVAVVGRFKAGKSSFVNEMLGAKLAGEDTNRETAAVTTFRHGRAVKATIRFVSAEAWAGMRDLHAEDPKHVDAFRVKTWEGFRGKPPKSTADGEAAETFDLNALEKLYVRPGGHSIQIELQKQGEKSGEPAFRKKLKEFTSGNRPHHCLVEDIEITSPAEILEEGVLLIDTPGLEDTERFRVALTERAVEGVDAVLFLTKSGASYGQPEKDFVLTLLRKGTVKQLMFVVTQIDHTYEQHCRNAENNDEEPDSIARRVAIEEANVRAEIQATLAELAADDSPAVRRYQEQLGEVQVAFTSAANHRDWKAGKDVKAGLYAGDPGGIDSVKRRLLRLLSTESRLANVARNIANGSKSALDDLLGVIESRRLALRDIKDGEVAEQRLATFRDEFAACRQRFESAAESELRVLEQNLADSHNRNKTLIENIGLLAERELADVETNDVGRHWRTRRSGYWGYMHGLQARIANRIFPKVQSLLSDMTGHFAAFVSRFEKHLNALSTSSRELSEKLELGAGLPLDFTAALKGALEKSMKAADELIAAEEQKIVSVLDDFVDDEVSERITAAREKVSNIWGQGTTYSQSVQVRAFYAELKELLQEALRSHLAKSAKEFGGFLGTEAAGVPRNAIAEVNAVLANAEQDLKAAAAAKHGEAREQFEKAAELIAADSRVVIERSQAVLQRIGAAEASSTAAATSAPLMPAAPKVVKTEPRAAAKTDAKPATVAASPKRASGTIDGDDWVETVQARATEMIERLTLAEDSQNWEWGRIFKPELVKGSAKVALFDPYLSQHHQLRNLKEFVIAIAEAAKPKELQVVTSPTWTEPESASARTFDKIAQDVFQDYGVVLTVKVDKAQHDRAVVCDNGTLFKLGRGLDIYKPATGLASHRHASRRVRRCEIDVFRVPSP